MSSRGKRLLAATGLALLTAGVYAASLGNGFALYDDGLLIYENNAVREFSLHTLKAVFTSYDPELYIPLTIFSYQLNYLIGGYHPFMYHATSLLLHIGSVLLVSWITLTLTRRTLVALFVGILFAVHPLHVETVVWAAARKDVLSSFFFLATFASYLCHLEPAEGSKRWYFLSLALFLLGLLAKVTILTLPIVLLLTESFLHFKKENRVEDVSFFRTQTLTRTLCRILPFFALSILFGIIALGGKGNVIDTVSVTEKILLAGKSMLFVLGKIFLPINLSPFYPQLTPIEISHPGFLIAVTIVSLITLAAFLLLFHRTEASSEGLPTLQYMAFGWLFFLVTLAPMFLAPSKGGENIYVTSDRYAYLPSIGILLAIGMLLSVFLEKAGSGHTQASRMKGVFLGVGALTCVFAFLTLKQSLLWGDNVALFAHAAEVSPNFYFAHINHGAALRLERRLAEAEAAFRRAIVLRELGNTHGLLAQVLAEQNKFDEAIAEFEKGMLLNPKDYELHHGLGQVYSLQGKFKEALSEYERALALMPETKNAYEKLSRRIGARRDVVLERIGILYGEQGNHERAIEYYRKALEENPLFADAHYNLAVGLGILGRKDEAMLHYEEAVHLEPLHIRARVNLAMQYAEKGRKQEAMTLLRQVLEDDPRNEIARSALEQMQRMR